MTSLTSDKVNQPQSAPWSSTLVRLAQHQNCPEDSFQLRYREVDATNHPGLTTMISDNMKQEVCSLYKANKLEMYAVADAIG